MHTDQIQMKYCGEISLLQAVCILQAVYIKLSKLHSIKSSKSGKLLYSV